MQPFGPALAANDHLGGVLGDNGMAEPLHAEIGTEKHHLVASVAQPLGGVTGTIGIEPAHHDTTSVHALSVTPRREPPHTQTPREAAQASLQGPGNRADNPYSPALHFDVTRESPRLDEFLPAPRRFPA